MTNPTTRAKHNRRMRQIKELTDTMPDNHIDLLFSVPRRGTYAWNKREILRSRIGCEVFSFGPIPEVE